MKFGNWQALRLALGLAWVPAAVTLAAVPCPPPEVTVQGGSSAQTQCPAGTSGGSSTLYTTYFPNNENPISEGGKWQHNGLDWTTVVTEYGHAHGTQNNSTILYNDSYAYLSGFPANQSAQAVIYNNSTTDINQEVELLLRWSDSAHNAQGYEINIQMNGEYAEIVRWNGPYGSWQELTRAAAPPVPKTGDIYKATIVGNVITVYYNDAKIMETSDSTWTTGQPGIGFYVGPGASNSEFGFSQYTASAL